MLTYSFSDIGTDCYYEYLYKCIKNDIINKILLPNNKLPSKRAFAKNLNISTITIENAYAQLMAEGYIYSIPKKGYYVAEISASISSKQKKKIASKENTPEKKLFFADFVSNQPNPDTFPFSIWAKLMREVMTEKQQALLTPPPSGGIMELRTAIAKHLYEFRGMHISPKQIVIGAGTEYLYGLLIQLLGYDKVYAVEDPGYQKIAQVYKSSQVACVHIPLDQHGVSVEALEDSMADIVHLSPNHHFPTGIVTPISRRYELLGWASKSESRYIIEDDYDSEFRMMGKPIPSLQGIDVSEKVIYMNTFTKSLSPTIRISYMVLPAHLIQRYYNKLSFYSCTVSNFEQYTLAKFIEEGFFEKHINRMRNYYREQRNTLLNCIKTSPLSSMVKIAEEDAGLHFLMYLYSTLTEAEIMERMEQADINITFLSKYYHETPALSYSKCPNESEHVLIMNYSGLPRENMEEMINRFSNCLI